jgi:pimeloyl-ACP methyl ester carboxylesterase
MNSRLRALRALHASLGRIAPDTVASRARARFLTPTRHATRPWEASVEARGVRERLASGASLLRFPAEGPKVLAIHGWEGRATQWGPLAERLAPRGLELLALDGPAHGASPGDEAHPVAFARALLEADRERGPFSAVVGHSMGGGAVAIALAWGLRADRAAVLASPSSIEGVLTRFGRLIGLPPGAQRRFIGAIEAHVGLPAAEIEVARLASKLTVPGLVVHDRDDLEVPFGEGATIARAWPGAELMTTEGLGHRRILRDERVLEAVTRFLVHDAALAAE